MNYHEDDIFKHLLTKLSLKKNFFSQRIMMNNTLILEKEKKKQKIK